MPDTICGICREETCDFVTRCKHHFHQNCLNQWLLRESICPYCKNTVTSNQKLEELLTDFTGTEEQIKKLDKDTIVSLFESKYCNYPVEDVLKHYLKLKGSINKVNDKKITLLHKAVENSNEELVKALVKNRAKLDLRDVDGNTPLHIACKNLNLPIVKILIEAGAKNDKRDSYGCPPFFYAIDSRDSEAKLLKYLLGADLCDLKTREKRKKNCLFYAVKNGTVEMFNLLVEREADPDSECELGWTLLHEAVVCDKIEILRILLGEHELFPDMPDEDEGVTPIILAAENGSYETVKLLLQHGADPDSRNREYHTFALHFAAVNNDYEMAELLLQHGNRTINKYPFLDNPPIFQALKQKSFKMAELLISHGADIKLKDFRGSNIVEFLCKNNVLKEGLDFLLNYTKLSLQDFMKEYAPNTKSLLFTCFLHGAMDNIEDLQKLGYDIDEKEDANSNTMLHLACKMGSAKLVEFLLGLGANPLARNKGDETPLLLSIGTPYFERVLESCPNPIDDPNSNDQGPPVAYVFTAAGLKLKDSVKALINHGAGVNISTPPCTQPS